jgi:uncharacterized RDD family membrane protein YckC
MASSPRGIVTPEAVVLDFETAGIGSRTLALAIDLAAQAAALLALNLALVVFALSGGDDLGWVGVAVLLVLYFLVLFGYPVAMETLWRGRTLGKAALGLRVVTVEGAPVRFRHAAIRSALGLVDFYLAGGFFAIVSILLTKRNQRLGDLVAGTLVLRERRAGGVATAVAFPPPPGFEAYVASLRPSALPADHYGLVRSFLLRRNELSPDARARLSVRLGNAVALALRHRPPPMVGPELFLACVAAAYQGREHPAATAASPDAFWGHERSESLPWRPQNEGDQAPDGFAPPQ